MAKRRSKTSKTFQQRQTERRLVEQQDQQEVESIVEDLAAKYSCSTETARDFALQCSSRLDDLLYDVDCTAAALDFWAEAPDHVAPVVDALRDLAAEHERHARELAELRRRLNELTQNATLHHHLERPTEHYENQLRLRLFAEPDPRPVQNHALSHDH